MNRKALKWLLDLLDDKELYRMATSYKVIVHGYRPNRTPREKLIQALVDSNAFLNIIKDLKLMFLEEKEPYAVLSEIEVNSLLKNTDTDIPALLLTLAFHTDPEYQRLAEIVLEEVNKGGPFDYVNARKTKKEGLGKQENTVERIKELETAIQHVKNKNIDLTNKLNIARDTIIKLRQLQKAEKVKVIAGDHLAQDYMNLKLENAILETALKNKAQEIEFLKKANIELKESSKCLELNIQAIKAQLIDAQKAAKEVSVAVTPRTILVGGKTAETLSQQSSSLQFLQEDDLPHIKENFFDEYDRILLPLYNSTTMTQVKLSQLAAHKVIQFSNHIELIRYLKGAI